MNKLSLFSSHWLPSLYTYTNIYVMNTIIMGGIYVIKLKRNTELQRHRCFHFQIDACIDSNLLMILSIQN